MASAAALAISAKDHFTNMQALGGHVSLRHNLLRHPSHGSVQDLRWNMLADTKLNISICSNARHDSIKFNFPSQSIVLAALTREQHILKAFAHELSGYMPGLQSSCAA